MKTPVVGWLRTMLAGLLVIAGLVALIALFYAFENWRGWRAVEREKRTLAAVGERWDWAEFVPPPVPDGQNFAMTPLLKPVFDYEQSTGSGQMRWFDPDGLNRLGRVRLDYDPRFPSRPSPSFDGFQLGDPAPIDFEYWQEFFPNSPDHLEPDPSRSAAANVLAALSTFDAELSELTTAAATRPFTRFPVHYEDEDKWRIPLPHLARLKGISYVVALRAAARLEVGRGSEALSDVRLGLRLADAPRGEPFLISFLVRLAEYSIGLKSVQQGLAKHAWNPEQLTLLQQTVQSIDFLADYKLAMRGDRACSTASLEYFGCGRDRRELRAHLADVLPANSVRDWQTCALVFGLMPRGWFRQQEVALSRFHQNCTLPMVDGKARRVNPDLMRAATNRAATVWRVPLPMPIQQFFSEVPLAALKTARSQTWVDQSVVACALERYRLSHGQLPDTLTALVPQFVNRLPTDLIDGQPLRYFRKGNGYIVYSVGWNKVDDGGKPARTPDAGSSANAAEGDWVWSLSE